MLDRGIAVSSIAGGFQLFRQAAPSCHHLSSDPSQSPKMILWLNGLDESLASDAVFCATHILLPPPGLLFPEQRAPMISPDNQASTRRRSDLKLCIGR